MVAEDDQEEEEVHQDDYFGVRLQLFKKNLFVSCEKIQIKNIKKNKNFFSKYY